MSSSSERAARSQLPELKPGIFLIIVIIINEVRGEANSRKLFPIQSVNVPALKCHLASHGVPIMHGNKEAG